MSSSSRVSIPSGLRKTIQNIKEIAGNHSDEEVYAMLKECAMDPNETTDKLLLQDTFHEVKRKRDKRKEGNKDPVESKWRPGVQGRGGRGGRGNYSSRYVAYDTGGGRNASTGKEIGPNQGAEKGLTSSSSANTPDMEHKTSISSSSSLANGPMKVDHPTPQGSSGRATGVSVIISMIESSTVETNSVGSTPPFPIDVKGGSTSGESVLVSDQSASTTPASASGVYASASDPVLMPSLDAHIPGVVGTIRREVGSQRAVVEPTLDKGASCDTAGPEWSTISGKGSSISYQNIDGTVQSKSQAFETNKLSDNTQSVASTSFSGSTGSRPSSNYSNRSQQLSSSQKVGPGKEWKPKSTQVITAQASRALDTSVAEPTTVEPVAQSLPALSPSAREDTPEKLGNKLEELRVSETQHVIIPHHLQVPESEKHGLSFGSFDASFKMEMGFGNGPASEKSSTPPSESSQDIEENIDEPSSSMHNASPIAEEADYPEHPQSPTQLPENPSSREADISSNVSAVPEYEQPKPEAALTPDSSQYPGVPTAPAYSTFGLMPPLPGSQFTSFESTESQARDMTRIPNFVVQQPFDPSTSFYAQIYRPTADGDGRFSPFLPPGAATKYNGNVAVLPAQASQSPQEIGNPLVLSSAGSTALTTQAAGVMQNSIAVTQQPVPVFRQPPGVHISHYPPSYLPYNQYFSPVYVPSPLHHFLSNPAYPQQPPTSSMYPPPTAAAAAAATPLKYSMSQYKPGTNTGNSNHIGVPTGYGTYTSAPAGYNPSPAVSNGNSTVNEELTSSQYKENSSYTGQQSEGSAVWFPTPGRDVSGLPASSFYNLPPQGQHMTYAPTQAGHGAFPGIYHPTTVPATAMHPLLQQSQTMGGPVEMVGPPSGVYQQPQRGQINWPNNY